jgi:hypothetical protein
MAKKGNRIQVILERKHKRPLVLQEPKIPHNKETKNNNQID